LVASGILARVTTRLRQVLAATAVGLSTLTLVSACGDDGASGGKPSGSSSEQTAEVIRVTIEGDDVKPNGERVEVAVGQPVVLEVTADQAGEIHVHSTPEQELEYQAGETELTLEPIEQPGTVDVESHALEKVIVQLEVS
jgi:hypothetical protein